MLTSELLKECKTMLDFPEFSMEKNSFGKNQDNPKIKVSDNSKIKVSDNPNFKIENGESRNVENLSRLFDLRLFKLPIASEKFLGCLTSAVGSKSLSIKPK
ncbi:hypothetical protein GJ496_003088 [Pomphorhynchus laevis]|nr:hypothetical protein GJ496_003088 [Pomphorhynchus laevis]